jgi:hypothetical protein
MGEPERQYQPVDLLEFKRRLLARTTSSSNPNEDPLAELARIIGGSGRIIPADALRDEISAGPRMLAGALAARQPKINLEPVQWTDWRPAEDQSPHDAAVAPLSEPVDLDENAQEELRSPVGWAPYSNENFIDESADDARLRLHNRKHANMTLVVTAAAVLVVGVLAILIFRLGESAPSPADRHAAAAPVATAQPASANAAPESQLNAAANAAPKADAAAQPSSRAQSNSASDAGAAVVSASASPNSPSPVQDAGAFPQPKRVRTVPIYANGPISEPATIVPDGTPALANVAPAAATAAPAGVPAAPAGASAMPAAAPVGPNGASTGPEDRAPAGPAPGLTFARLVEAQKLQMPTAAPPTAAARDDAGPTTGLDTDITFVAPPKVAARPAARPAPSVAATGATYAAILASSGSESAARGMLAELQKKYGAALGTHRLSFHRASRVDGTVYEIRAAGLDDDDAQALCAKLSSAGASCQVAGQ